MKIKLWSGKTTIQAVLVDSDAAEAFFSQLPLKLTLKGFASNEKIAYLPHKLTLGARDKGSDASVADLMYYAPWGNIAIFYGNASYCPDLIRLGKIVTGVDSISSLKEGNELVIEQDK
jgi:hypothetical protein